MAGPLCGLQRSKHARLSGLSRIPVMLRQGSERQKLAKNGSWNQLAITRTNPLWQRRPIRCGGVVAQILSSMRICSSATDPEPPFSSLLKALRFCRGT